MRRLSRGALLKSAAGGLSGRIGAFATDATGTIFALTARHVLKTWRGKTSAFDERGERVGRALAIGRIAPEAPLHDEIARVRIDIGWSPIEDHVGDRMSGLCAVPRLDQQVEWQSPTGRIYRGVVSEVGGMARLVGLGVPASIATDLIEVEFDASRGPREFPPGEAGSLFLDRDGHAVGLLIAGDLARCYLAPLAPYLLQHALALWLPDPFGLRDGTLAFQRSITSGPTAFRAVDQRPPPEVENREVPFDLVA